jgi:hypothetical protein
MSRSRPCQEVPDRATPGRVEDAYTPPDLRWRWQRYRLGIVSTRVRLHRAQDPRLVVDNQDSRPGSLAHVADTARVGASAGTPATGNVKTKRAPPPPRFSARARLPCASTRPLTIASPNPRPCGRGCQLAIGRASLKSCCSRRSERESGSSPCWLRNRIAPETWPTWRSPMASTRTSCTT